MNERARLVVKIPEAKIESYASKTTQKPAFLQSISSSVDHILFLHKTIGNQAVQRLVTSGAIQAKLKISQPNDIYEQEADRVAEQVMRMSVNTVVREQELGVRKGDKPIQIKPGCPSCKEEELIHPKLKITPLVQRQVEEKKEKTETEDATIEALDLASKAKEAAKELKKKYPDIIFTNGHRNVADQASAMAENIVVSKNRKWIENTYSKSEARDKLQKWVNDNPDKKTKDEITKGLETTMSAMEESELKHISKHLSGEAFDVQPTEKDADAIKKDIKALPGITKFLEKEGELVCWHAQFKNINYASQLNDEFNNEQMVDQLSYSHGQPLDMTTRAFFEPRFGYDFSQVRVHADSEAIQINRKLNAEAFTHGRDIYFGAGRYSPGTSSDRRLLAHELTHVVQQGQSDNIHIQRACGQAAIASAVGARAGCSNLLDRTFVSGSLFKFNKSCDEFTPGQKMALLSFAIRLPATATLEIHGFASVDGPLDFNQNLGCARALKAQSFLTTPNPFLGFAGIAASRITGIINHGPVPGPVADRRSVVIRTTTPTPTPPAPCTLPIRLGSARGCGSGNDFAHFDLPGISAKSEVKLGAWASAHPDNFSRLPFRSSVSDAACELEMDTVLTSLASSAGHAVFSRFASGTGGTQTHGPTSALGAMALGCGSFLATVAIVKANIEAQLATQAASGVLNPCALSVTPPATHFKVSDGMALKAVIGGTQGEELFATGFAGSIPTRSYSIDLRFVICDDFGVDESDLYAPGLFAFWVLQHERSATRYAPFINQLALPVRVSGTF